MDPNNPKATYRHIIEAINANDVEALAALVDPDIVDHNPIPDQAPGLAGFRQWMDSARRSFPDLHGTIEQLLAEADLVAARVTWRGTQAGSFAGAAPTGRPASFEAYHIVRFAGGRAAEWWGTADIFGALAQLGVLPGSSPTTS
jgi:predicted ester cyclase